MSKKLVKHGDDLAIIINKQLLKKFNMNENTTFEIIDENGSLIIKFQEKEKNKNKKLSKKRSIKSLIKFLKNMMMYLNDYQKHESHKFC